MGLLVEPVPVTHNVRPETKARRRPSLTSPVPPRKTANELHFARVDVKAAEERVMEVKGQLAALTKVG